MRHFFSNSLVQSIIGNLSSRECTREGLPWSTVFGVALWYILKWRNNRVFGEEKTLGSGKYGWMEISTNGVDETKCG